MTYQDSSDQELVKAVLDGRQDAFCFLMERYKNALYGMVLKQVQDKIVAEEICQESFVKAYLGLKKFRFNASFSTWLTRIGLNLTHSYFSSKQFKLLRQQVSFEIEQHEMNISQEENPSQPEQRVQQFTFALAQLKPKFRDVIVLCGLEGKSYEEAAQILNVPIGTIRSRLNSARLMIKTTLVKEFAFESKHEA